MMKPSIEQGNFYFKIPEYDPELSKAANIAKQMGAKASRLVLEERTRTHHPDGRRENVAEHSHMLALVAPELAVELYSHLDPNLVARFATIHDNIEAYVGDTPTDRIDAQGRLDKSEREAQGLEQLMQDYAHMPEYCRRIKEYEEQVIPEARFVRLVDKIMVLLIHIPNEGKTLKENYTRESLSHHIKEADERWRRTFPEFEELNDMRTELAQHLCDLYLPE